MAQLGARLNGIEKVAGSSPAGSTFWRFYSKNVIEEAKTTAIDPEWHQQPFPRHTLPSQVLSRWRHCRPEEGHFTVPAMWQAT